MSAVWRFRRVLGALGLLVNMVVAKPTVAQDQPVVFVHGLTSDGSAWNYM